MSENAPRPADLLAEEPLSPLSACVALMALCCFLTNSGLSIAFVLSVLLAAQRVSQRGWRDFHGLRGADGPIALFVLSHFASAVMGVDPAHSLAYTSELKRILIAYIVANTLSSWRDVTVTFAAAVAGGVATTAYAFHQWINGATVTIHHETLTRAPGAWLSPNGFASTSNDLASLLLLALGLVAGPFLFYRLAGPMRFTTGALTVVLWAGVLRSLSRSGLIGGIAGVVALGVVLSPRRLIVPLLAMASIYPLLPGHVTSRHGQIFDLDVYPNQFRIRMVEVSLDMMKEHRLFGIGRRNFLPLHTRTRRPGEEPSPHAHNNYLNVLVEQGPLGLVALLWLQVSLFATLVRTLRSADRKMPEAAALGGVFSALVGFTVAGLFLFTLGDAMPATMMWILVGTGYALVAQIERKQALAGLHVDWQTPDAQIRASAA